ncbi:MAG: DUF433 domain-containing protein [Candidatus Rokuibacteriota bacterium]
MYLTRMADRDGTPTGAEAAYNGPWRVEPIPGKGFGVFRAEEAAEDEPAPPRPAHALPAARRARLPALRASWCYDAATVKPADLPDPEQRHDAIAATPGVCGGRARVAGTRIKVSQVASEVEHLGMTPDEIVDAHPHLTLAGVRAALAYYDAHRDEIRAEWREADDLIATMREQHTALSTGKRSSS